MLACLMLAACAGTAATAGFGTGNWGGSSIGVGPNTFYNNGLVSRQIGGHEFFNNGIVGMNYGNVTLYSNGLAAKNTRPTSGHAPNLDVQHQKTSLFAARRSLPPKVIELR